jgi:hypothetical protein
LAGKQEGRRPLERPRSRWVDSIIKLWHKITFI